MNQNNKVKKHRDRDDLTGEHIFGDAGQIVLFLIFLTVWIIDSFILKYSVTLCKYIPLYIRLPVSLALLLGSALLARAGLYKVFDEIRDRPAVIQDGIFSRMRHPIYLVPCCFMADCVC